MSPLTLSSRNMHVWGLNLTSLSLPAINGRSNITSNEGEVQMSGVKWSTAVTMDSTVGSRGLKLLCDRQQGEAVQADGILEWRGHWECVRNYYYYWFYIVTRIGNIGTAICNVLQKYSELPPTYAGTLQFTTILINKLSTLTHFTYITAIYSPLHLI